MQKLFAKTARPVLLLLSILTMMTAVVHAATGPLNDNFANAQQITDNEGSVQGSNVGATKEAGEPNHAGNIGGMSAWFRWTSPHSGTAQFSTAYSNFDTILGIYTGSSVSALTEVAHGDDTNTFDKTSRASFSAVEGTSYYIAVDGFNEKGTVANGSITLSWTLPPPNDNFADAQTLTGTSGQVGGTLYGATVETGDPLRYRSIWYRFTAPSNGVLNVDTLSGYADVQLYTGTTLTTLTAIPDVNDETVLSSNKSVAVRGGSVIYIGMSYHYAIDINFTYSFIADAIAPTVTITRPAANTYIKSLRAIRGTAADNLGGSGLKEITGLKDINVPNVQHIDGLRNKD